MTITENAYAKLNISLDITSRLPDGYHEMKMIMQSVSLHDKVTVSDTKGSVRVKTNLPFLPSDGKNIAFKAAKAFFEHTGINGGADIIIKKSIPVCSGMGGGSSDAAAVLRALNIIYNAGLSVGELQTIGNTVGSDVPFCINGGTSLATGKGEILSALPPLPDCDILICKPEFSISTPELFGKIKCDKIRLRPDTDGMVDAIRYSDIKSVARRMYNVFLDVLPPSAKPIFDIIESLIDLGADGAVMTGTGSGVFGIFTDTSIAENAESVLKKKYHTCCLAKPVPAIFD